MKINQEVNFEELKKMVWSNAIDTLKVIEENDKQDEFEVLIEEMFLDGVNLTTLNDFLRFDDETIFNLLDIKNY